MLLFFKMGGFNLIKIENLTKYYYTTTSVTCALRKINLEMNRGEFIAITGESGSGKTTLLNVISGFDTYEEGEIYYKNKPTSFYSKEDFENLRKNEIAFIFQNYNLIDSFSVYENVYVTFIIDGISKKQARTKTLELLDKVGLKAEASKKASKLSGGQKQRLSIARALAKETDVIIADEPTGNLDALNGLQIMKLLKDLAKDKLIIVVTHNQEEVMPFITRKIRLHDGNVVSDEKIDEPKIAEVTKKAPSKPKFNDALRFFFLNFKAQPKRTIFIYLLSFLVSITCFIFIGTFFQNLDDTKTRIISDEIFYNHDELRLIVTPSDERDVTSEDYWNALVKNVSSVEKYDLITDINYYMPEDYKVTERGGYIESPDGSVTPQVTTSTTLLNNNRYMRSVTSINDFDLAYGELPLNNLEMVIYSTDQSLIGTTKKVLFSNRRCFGKDEYLEYNVKISGLLKEPTTQVYFSEDLCKVMTLTNYKFEITAKYNAKNEYGITRGYTLEFSKAVIDYDVEEGSMSLPTSKQEVIMGLVNTNKIQSYEGKVLMPTFFVYREDKEVLVDEERQIYVDLSHSLTNDMNTLGLSVSLFNFLYDKVVTPKQFVVFVDDYSYTKEVMNRLAEKGFLSISAYQVSAKTYDYKLVAERFITLFVCVIGIVIILLIEYAILYALMKLKKNEYTIYKMIGMPRAISSIATRVEMCAYGILSLISLIITSLIVSQTTNNIYLLEFYKYIRWYHYVIVFVINIITLQLVARSFNIYLTKHASVNLAKEE